AKMGYGLSQSPAGSTAQRRGRAMDTIEKVAGGHTRMLAALPERLHHNAYVVKDHEANRRFLEDLLGIPLLATWCERSYRPDLGYCKSIYTPSPDGMILEFTCDPPDVAEIDALRRSDAHSELKRWLKGDRRVNNQLRHG